LREQNWAAVAIDLLVVIVGVFLAFQFEELYTNRNLRAEEFRHLAALKEDFQQNQINLERMRVRYTLNRDSGLALLEASSSNTVTISESELYRLMSHAIRFGRITVVRRTWDVLTAGGEINVIQNDTLKAQISAFYAECEVVLGNYNELSNFWDDLDLYLFEILDYVEIVREYHPEELNTVDTVQSDFDISALLRNPEFRDRVGHKWHLTRDFLVRFEGLLDQIARILTELDEDLVSQPSV
jgi:hypothetical protein